MAITDKRERQLDAERGVIGSLLIDNEITRNLLSAVDEQDFLNPVNRLIFQTARALFRAGSPVDPITIRSRIGDQYTDYLVQLMEITPTAAAWQTYAEIMHEQATLLRIFELAGDLRDAVTLDDCRPLCAKLGQLLTDGRKLNAWGMQELLDSFFQSQDPNEPPVNYVNLGIPILDKGSFIELGDVVIIGGYPSDGKTALSIMLAWNMAKAYRVGFFSLETNHEKFRDRLMTHAAQISFADIKRRTISESDWKRVAEQSREFAERGLTVIEAAGMTAMDIQSVSQAYDFQVIFVDYIQLVTPDKTSSSNRAEQMARISMEMHTFAQRSKTLVVELAQLSRPEKGGWREPNMHDLKETGQFEQDADVILLLYQPDPKDKNFNSEQHRYLNVVKNKEARKGKWPLYFDGDRQTFSVAADDSGRVMRTLINAGKNAASQNKARAENEKEAHQVKITELPAVDGDLPF